MTEAELAAAVDSQAALLELPLAAGHREGTMDNFARIAAIAALFMGFPLPPETEPAPVFSPDRDAG